MIKLLLKRFSLLTLLFLHWPLWSQTSKSLKKRSDPHGRIKQLQIKNLSDLQKLTPYQSVSVIQRRYLPKTFRSEVNLSVSSVINHSFFYFAGASARAGFFIREDHGFGVELFVFSPPFFKGLSGDLTEKGILPVSSAFSQLYGGVYYKWSPVFGKFAVLNSQIIYFDIYMTVSLGMARILSVEETIKQKLISLNKKADDIEFDKLSKNFFPSGALGLGQTFALSQDWALNWEIKWIGSLFQYQKPGSDSLSSGHYWNINFSLGLNYYFPGAGYR